jgi:hypothetical protein
VTAPTARVWKRVCNSARSGMRVLPNVAADPPEEGKKDDERQSALDEGNGDVKDPVWFRGEVDVEDSRREGRNCQPDTA